VVDGSRRLRAEGVHMSLPGIESRYDCTADLGPPFDGDCTGRAAGDTRVLMRLSELDTW
jgi:hypothetical protein